MRFRALTVGEGAADEKSLLPTCSYVLTLVTDGMRGVRNILFEKAAAGVLASCVSELMSQPRPVVLAVLFLPSRSAQ